MAPQVCVYSYVSNIKPPKFDHRITSQTTADQKNRARYQRLTSDKQKKLACSHRTFLRHATRFNEAFRPANLIPTPSFESINRMKIDDPFWEIEDLTHPNEDWAVDPLTRSGIDAWRIQRSSREEMRRIGRELRQQLQWALVYSSKVKDLERNSKPPDQYKLWNKNRMYC